MKKALIVVDVQNEYFADAGGQFPQWEAETVAQRIAERIRLALAEGEWVVAVRHESAAADAALFRPGSQAAALHVSVSALLDGAPQVVKQRADAFLGTPLDGMLRAEGIGEIELCGIMTQNCITHTALSPTAAAYRVQVRADCCTAPTQLVHAVALDALGDRIEVV